MITVSFVPETETKPQVVTAQLEPITLKEMPNALLVILNSVKLVLMTQEIVLSVKEIWSIHQHVSHQPHLLNPSMLRISQSDLLRLLFVTLNVLLVKNSVIIV
jgi:hypothetical protein